MKYRAKHDRRRGGKTRSSSRRLLWLAPCDTCGAIVDESWDRIARCRACASVVDATDERELADGSTLVSMKHGCTFLLGLALALVGGGACDDRDAGEACDVEVGEELPDNDDVCEYVAIVFDCMRVRFSVDEIEALSEGDLRVEMSNCDDSVEVCASSVESRRRLDDAAVLELGGETRNCG